MSEDQNRGTCQACGADILWATTIAGKHMPLDPDVHPLGNVVFEPDGRARVLPKGSTDARARRRPHFSTCPSWSRKPRRSPDATRKAQEPRT